MSTMTPEQKKPAGVSTIELFFDLVFVFVITQITLLVEHAHGPTDLLLAFLVLVPVWWMYAAYSWLTNNTGGGWQMRLVLIAAMAGFLIMAMSIPSVFGAGALAFGLSYLFVVLLHLGAFVFKGGPSLQAIFGIAQFNVGAAVLLIAAPVAGQWSWAVFLVVAVLFVGATIVRREQGFALEPTHFAERHGLVILIVLGESVVAIAMGASTSSGAVDLATLVEVVLCLLLVTALWWSYFDREDKSAEHLLVAASPERRSRMGLLGYWYGHLALIFGIVLISAGIELLLEHGTQASSSGATLLFGGVAVYMLGDVFFRWIMGMTPIAIRLVAGALGLVMCAIGAHWAAQPALAAAAALAIAVVAVERLQSRRA